jgi:hypothetical protein
VTANARPREIVAAESMEQLRRIEAVERLTAVLEANHRSWSESSKSSLPASNSSIASLPVVGCADDSHRNGHDAADWNLLPNKLPETPENQKNGNLIVASASDPAARSRSAETSQVAAAAVLSADPPSSPTSGGGAPGGRITFHKGQTCGKVIDWTSRVESRGPSAQETDEWLASGSMWVCCR